MRKINSPVAFFPFPRGNHFHLGGLFFGFVRLFISLNNMLALLWLDFPILEINF